MPRLESRLIVLEKKIENISKSIDEAHAASHNVTLLGISKTRANETVISVTETSQLCVDIFNAMGAIVSHCRY